MGLPFIQETTLPECRSKIRISFYFSCKSDSFENPGPVGPRPRDRTSGEVLVFVRPEPLCAVSTGHGRRGPSNPGRGGREAGQYHTVQWGTVECIDVPFDRR